MPVAFPVLHSLLHVAVNRVTFKRPTHRMVNPIFNLKQINQLKQEPFIEINKQEIEKNTTTMSLNSKELENWESEFKQDKTHNLASTVLKNSNADEVLLDKTAMLSIDKQTYNIGIPKDELVTPVANQKSSGRCWLFAATNCLRLQIAKDLNIKENFEISQAYLFFYDKLEKCCYFLDQIIDTADQDVDSRLVQYMLQIPINDGGQYSMFLNIVNKYGLMPKDLYNDLPYSTTASAKWNNLLVMKLREFAQILREHINVKKASSKDVQILKKSMQKEIFRLMSLFMDPPSVKPDESFTWEYSDKDKILRTVTCTPKEFASKICKVDSKKCVSLVNDPRNEYNKLIKVDRLGNVTGGDPVLYLNVDNKTLTSLAVKRLKAKKPIFFGAHTPMFMDKKSGVMSSKIYNYDAIDYNFKQDKKNRIQHGNSLMTHAMTITNAYIDSNTETPIRYKVENSWGKESGNDGYYMMDQEYFEEYCFQIVCDLDELPKELQAKLDDSKPILLPLYDPMGALA